MPFFLYSKINIGADIKYMKVRSIKIAGSNLIKKIWEEKNKIKDGWHISEEDIRNYLKITGNSPNTTILFDYKPDSKAVKIGLLELREIFAYTYKNESDIHEWTILMLFLNELVLTCMNSDKSEFYKNEFQNPEIETNIYEFLYLQSDWKWGKTGRVNAALLYKEPLKYFLEKLNSNTALISKV